MPRKIMELLPLLGMHVVLGAAMVLVGSVLLAKKVLLLASCHHGPCVSATPPFKVIPSASTMD
jgi:hypothetical protein